MEAWSMPVLLNVGGYLRPTELLSGLGLTCRGLQEKVKGLLGPLLREYIVNGAALQGMSGTVCQALLCSPPHLLRFLPLYYNGGVSTREVVNSFEAMWEFSGLCYSTFYSEGKDQALADRLAVGYFAGVAGENRMREEFHYDLTMIKMMPWEVQDEVWEILARDKRAALTLDFLTPCYKKEPAMIMPEAEWNRLCSKIHNSAAETVPVLQRMYPYSPLASNLALVREVCVARPLLYTGSVKTLLIIVGRLAGDEMNPGVYRQWEGINTYEKAVQVGSHFPLRRLEGVEVLEFSAQTGDYWPLVWLHFPDRAHNHVRIPLQRPQTFCTAAVLFSSIEDTREAFHLSHLQPNFDIMFTVFLGHIVPA